jgi:hypothetical protein
MADEQGKKAIKIPVPVALGVITVVLAAAALAWAGSSSLYTVQHAPPGAAPGPTDADRAAVVAQMRTIQGDMVSAWQSCQADPSCQGQVQAIPDYQQLYDAKSTWFVGSAADDFGNWRVNTGMAEGDTKQWAINQIYGRPNPLASTVPVEIQNAGDDITHLASDLAAKS